MAFLACSFLQRYGFYSTNTAFYYAPHITRHTFVCTVALGQGISKDVLQFIMRHTSIKTTGIYAKLPMQYVSQNIGDKMLRT